MTTTLPSLQSDANRVDRLRTDILTAWHTSRAVSSSRYDRMLYVRKHIAPSWPDVAAKALWFHIEEFTSFAS